MSQPRAFLKFIEVENFKSYGPYQRIGPLKPFTAVIGPNGSGKSNLMDAISFVMGEKTQTLRVKRLADLVHGASTVGRAVSRSARVSAVFQLDAGVEKKFTRTVVRAASSSEYAVDDQSVAAPAYQSALEALGVSARRQNFLVFQGAVEEMALRSAKQRTALFEELCGSAALRDDYERGRTALLQAEEATQLTLMRRKGVVAERREAKLEKDEADRYRELSDDLRRRRVQLLLFQLFHCQRQVDDAERRLEGARRGAADAAEHRRRADRALEAGKQQHDDLCAQLTAIDKLIRTAESEVNKKRPDLIKAKERAVHVEKKLEAARKTLLQARRAAELHVQDVEQLQQQLADVEQRRRDFDGDQEAQGRSQGRDVRLEEQQVVRYQRLKEEAIRQAARHLQELDSLSRQQKSDADRLEHEKRQCAEVQDQRRQRLHEADEVRRRCQKIDDLIAETRTALDEQKQLETQLTVQVDSAKTLVDRLQSQLEQTQNDLTKALADKSEEARRRRKQDVLDNFRRLYGGGVYGRLVQLCQPVHARYQLAVTRLLGQYMEAVVVDTEETASLCVGYLKEQMLEPETFLPLTCLTVKPLQERLRLIKEPANVRLVFDVLSFEPAEVRRAVMFAARSALVCETPDDAARVAYEMDDGQRYDAVALDGTFYQKSGVISGGSKDLEKKAARWNEKKMATLKSNKERLAEELRQAVKTSRQEATLNATRLQVKGLEARLRFALADADAGRRQAEALDADVRRLDDQLRRLAPAASLLDEALERRAVEMADAERRAAQVRDAVLAEFCAEIGVADARHFEETQLRTQQERAKKRLEFENQENRIRNQLEFARARDSQSNVERWQRSVRADEEELEGARRRQREQSELIDADVGRVRQMQADRRQRQSQSDESDERVAVARRAAAAAAERLQAGHRQVAALQVLVDECKSRRHVFLAQCKVDDVAIPMSRGSVDDIAADGDVDDSTPVAASDSTNSQATVVNSQLVYDAESRITVDYSDLDAALKDISDADEVHRQGERLQRGVDELAAAVKRLQAPNMKAVEKMDQARKKMHESNEEFERARLAALKAKQAFDDVKKRRLDRFAACFQHVSGEIDAIYKSLTRRSSAVALLTTDDTDEPFCGGIDYCVILPGKPCRPMSGLSGGEKTLASLALLLALRSYEPAPFFVLDEIDAALDNSNIDKVAGFIRGQTANLQTVVISLKDQFYGRADALVGVSAAPGPCLVSHVFQVDLGEYPEQVWQQRRA